MLFVFFYDFVEPDYDMLWLGNYLTILVSLITPLWDEEADCLRVISHFCSNDSLFFVLVPKYVFECGISFRSFLSFVCVIRFLVGHLRTFDRPVHKK